MKKIFLLIVLVIGVLFIFTNKKISNTVSNKTPKTVPFANQKITQTSSGEIPNIPFSLKKGFTIHIFAKNLGKPRDLVFSPNGTLLASVPSQNKVVALPDKNSDGVADEEKTIITNENNVHGLSFFNGQLFIADVDKVVRYNFDESSITAKKDKELFSLPQNNNHNNRTLSFNKNGDMFISVGSTCNVCRQSPQQGGSVWISNNDGKTPEIFATGVRNAAFTTINPTTNELWGTEMGRDYLGDNIPPDEINIIKNGHNYGWPNCYAEKIHDKNFDKNNNSCQNTESPIFQIPAHSAPLGITFINSSQFPLGWQGDLLVSYHGSWNRSVAIGYKVVHLKVNGNTITSSEDFLTGFNTGSSNADSLGRPVDLVFDKKGNLYLSDDKAGNIYIIQKN